MGFTKLAGMPFGSISKLLLIYSGIVVVISFYVLPAKAENITLCYHRFGYSLDNPYSIPPELFEWQMKYIKERKIKILTLSQFNNETKKSSPFKNDSFSSQWMMGGRILTMFCHM